MYLCIAMNRRWIWFLAAGMAVVMIGLILVQAYWINNAMEVKEQQFKQIVYRTLGEVSSEVEQQEAMWHIMDEALPAAPDTISWHFNSYQVEQHRFPAPLRDSGNREITDAGELIPQPADSFSSEIVVGKDFIQRSEDRTYTEPG